MQTTRLAVAMQLVLSSTNGRIRIGKPRASAANLRAKSGVRISFRTNVCESRGNVVTMYPAVVVPSAFDGDRSAINKLQQSRGGSFRPVHVNRFVLCGQIVPLQVLQQSLRQHKR